MFDHAFHDRDADSKEGATSSTIDTAPRISRACIRFILPDFTDGRNFGDDGRILLAALSHFRYIARVKFAGESHDDGVVRWERAAAGGFTKRRAVIWAEFARLCRCERGRSKQRMNRISNGCRDNYKITGR